MKGIGHRASRMEKECSLINQGPNMTENSKKAKDTGLVNTTGPIQRSIMRENSATDKCTAEARKYGRMELSMMENGSIMNVMGKEVSSLQMASLMWENL